MSEKEIKSEDVSTLSLSDIIGNLTEVSSKRNKIYAGFGRNH